MVVATSFTARACVLAVVAISTIPMAEIASVTIIVSRKETAVLIMLPSAVDCSSTRMKVVLLVDVNLISSNRASATNCVR